MKIAAVEMEGQDENNIKSNNTQSKTIPIINNQPLIKYITSENHNKESTVVTSLISGHRYKRKYETNQAGSTVTTSEGDCRSEDGLCTESETSTKN